LPFSLGKQAHANCPSNFIEANFKLASSSSTNNGSKYHEMMLREYTCHFGFVVYLVPFLLAKGHFEFGG
jgi:hypothetical protein